MKFVEFHQFRLSNGEFLFQAKYRGNFSTVNGFVLLGKNVVNIFLKFRLTWRNIAAFSLNYHFKAMQTAGEISAIFRENKARNFSEIRLHYFCAILY